MASRPILSPSLVALAAALALAGCSKTADTTNAAADANVTAIDNQAAAVPPEDLVLPAGDNAVVEDQSTAPPIQIVEVPVPTSSAPAAETAPLTDAIAAEQLIDTGTGITRIQQADGWAWMQNGQIIRTASADGHRVSYFRRGMTTPYLVQQDGHSYAYDNGRVAREYDDHGRARAPDAQHQREAQQAADRAHQQHDRARQASRTAPHVDRGSNGSVIDHGSPHPQPSPSDHRGSNDDHGRTNGNDRDHGTGHATPSPTPSPTPSGHHDIRPSPDRHGDPRNGYDDGRSGGH